MRTVLLPITTEDVVEFEAPDTASDYNLGMQKQISVLQGEYAELLDEFNDFLYEVEEGFDERDKDLIDMDELEYRLQLVRNRKAQLRVVLPQSEHEKLDDLSELHVNLLYSLIVVADQDYEPICSFINVEAVKPDIEYWEKKKSELNPEFHSEKIWEIEERLERIKSGEFILVPVQDNIFQSKINTDNILKNFPQLEENDRNAITDAGWDISKLKEALNSATMSEQQILAKKKQLQAIKKYYREYQNEKYDSAAKILAHVCVPKGEAYHGDLAVAREPYFADMPLDIVGGLLAFFLNLIEIYQTSIVLSSQGQPDLS